MRKSTIFFTCIVLGGALFGIVFFYFGLWGGSDNSSKEAPRQKVVSEGGRTMIPDTKATPNPGTLPKTTESTGPITIVPAETDQLGYAKLSPQGAVVLGAGAKILQLSETGTFAVYWLPKEVKVDRVLVLLHDTAGTAYDEIADELALAKTNGYGLLALQWHTKATDTYQSPQEVYRSLASVLDWLDLEHSVQPKVRALMGVGRGSAATFEILSLDRSGRRFFQGVVNLSGGIPSDGVFDSKVAIRPDPFFVSMIVGQVAPDLYSGLRFYMYCGRQDELWGAKMCERTSSAQSLVVKYGAKVDALVISETLGQRGLRTDPGLHQAFIDWFLSL